MDAARRELLERLEAHYREHGWPTKRAGDGTIHASGPGGVTWVGTAILASDLGSDDLEARLIELAERRMDDGGELCPVDLLAEAKCEQELRALLDRVGLGGRPHVSVYSLAA